MRPPLLLALLIPLVAGCSGRAVRHESTARPDPRAAALRAQLEDARKTALKTMDKLGAARKESRELAEKLLAAQKERASALERVSRLQKEREAAEKELADLKKKYGRLDAELVEQIGSIPEAVADHTGAVRLVVSFELGGVQIPEEQQTAVEKLAGVLASRKGRVFVDGHSDNVPIKSAEAKKQYGDNLGLSLARASAVARILTRGGVDASRVVVRGFGSGRPVASNSTEAGRARNRRVEIRLTPAKAADR
ncbi:MAG: OmpA family protein [Planctomycetota bacterium]